MQQRPYICCTTSAADLYTVDSYTVDLPAVLVLGESNGQRADSLKSYINRLILGNLDESVVCIIWLPGKTKVGMTGNNSLRYERRDYNAVPPRN